MRVKVSHKGQFSIPAELRKKYDILKGGQLDIEDTGDGLKIRKVNEKIFELSEQWSKDPIKDDKPLERLDKLR